MNILLKALMGWNTVNIVSINLCVIFSFLDYNKEVEASSNHSFKKWMLPHTTLEMSVKK